MARTRINPDFATGTVTYDSTVLTSATFRLTRQGRVCNLNGQLIRLASNLPHDTTRTIATVPTGFRPAGFAYGIAFTAGGGVFYVYALADGTLAIRNNTGATISSSTNIYLSITYMT